MELFTKPLESVNKYDDAERRLFAGKTRLKLCTPAESIEEVGVEDTSSNDIPVALVTQETLAGVIQLNRRQNFYLLTRNTLDITR
mmetsp:Transcript_5754/g.8752  ORF Transcript_5754/g.8752 Transcript_5754/m.8752 type:complete len:85 (-) Transcript_5754:2727-2981(-)